MVVYYHVYGGILMIDKLFYQTEGQELLRNEPIYMNKVREQSESHLHAHDFIEIAYVVSGCGTHKIGDMEYEVSKGDLFIINYDIPHEFRSFKDPSKPRLWVYNCVFKPEFLDYKLVNCKDFYNITHHFLFRAIFSNDSAVDNDIKILGRDSIEIEEIYEKMYREYNLKEEGYIEILRAYVIELLITVFRLFRKNTSLGDGIKTQRQEIVHKVMNYMKENYSEDLRLEDLATIAFLSPNYFSRLFKECTSMTISEYIQKIRIEEACKMLKQTHKKVIDVAHDIGYKDIKYFNSIFKKITGKTPKEYRN